MAVIFSFSPARWQHFSRRALLALTLTAVGLSLSGCGPSGKASSNGKKKIITSFTILADMAREVAGDAADVDSITRPGAEIHGYSPTPKDIIKAQQADLVLWNGLNLEVWFAKFFQNVTDVPSAILSEGIEPMGITDGPYTGKPNPHAWMSPVNAVIYVENIRKALVQIDPANEAVYTANAKAYTAKIQALDVPVREKLAAIPESRRWLATSEGAFSYLCEAYQLKPLFLWPINADAQGTPQQVQAVIDAVRAHHVPVVFSESTISPEPIKQVAKETGATYGGVLYVDSLTDSTGPAPTYLKLLQTNADTILRGFTAAP